MGAVAVAAVLAAAAGLAQTVEEIVAKNVAARGGMEKIRGVQSLRMTGTMELGDERMPTALELKRPGKSRWEFTLDGQTAVQAFDGTTGWMFMPFAGQTEPQKMPAEELEDIKAQADIDGPLIDAKAKGNTIELVGKETVHGREAWKLKVTRSGGVSRFVFLDAATHLQTSTLTTRTVDGNTVEIESVIGDYRPVDGLMLPHSFEATAKGIPQKQALKFEKIEVNVPIDDARFRMPVGTAPSPPAGSPTPAAP
jgi:outer membrane lipoprotein-sorting protein